jgi:hypothetical protein
MSRVIRLLHIQGLHGNMAPFHGSPFNPVRERGDRKERRSSCSLRLRNTQAVQLLATTVLLYDSPSDGDYPPHRPMPR